MDKIFLTIVSYHNYNEIKDAIETIDKYTDKNLKKHIYIVDNGTKDESNMFYRFLGDTAAISIIGKTKTINSWRVGAGSPSDHGIFLVHSC